MTRDVLQERERGIEAQWARQHDEELIQKLRERAKLREISDVLAKKLRVEDPVLRQRILDLGFTRETGPGLFLVPLVQVAWADGEVTDREKETILGMAAIRGVAPGSPVHTQLLEWFHKPPSDALCDVAAEVIRVGISVLPEPERENRVAAFVETFRRVAEASGGGLRRALGMGHAVSAEEEAVIAKITAVLRG
jgi:hypothetical protein